MNTEPERKYRKQLNRNGWQASLYKWTTGNEPNFVGYCPFFWSVWFCLLVSPITLLGRGLFEGTRLFFEFFKPAPGENQPEDRLVLPTPNDLDLERAFEHGGVFGYPTGRLWAQENPEWITSHWPAALARLTAGRAKLAREQARKDYFQKKIDKLSGYLQYAVKPVLALSAVGLAWGIWGWIGSMLESVTWANLKSFGFTIALHAAVIGVIVAILTAVYGAVVGVIAISDRVKSLERKQGAVTERKPTFFGVVLDGIKEAFNFVIETIGTAYKKECPLIEWGNETKSIEKNQK